MKNHYGLLAKTVLSKRIIMLFALFIVPASTANGQSEFGFNALYSISNNISGVSFHRIWANKIGIYGEIKGLLSNPWDSKNGEAFTFVSGGLVKQVGNKIITYLGAGASWRNYYVEKAGTRWGMVGSNKLNITGGIIGINLGAGSLLNRLSYQIGIDSKPFGINVGIGLRFKL